MKTNDLVQLLAADARPTPPLRSVLLIAAGASGAVACLAFVALVGVRADLLSALAKPEVAFKFVFSAGVALAAAAYSVKASRPQDRQPTVAFFFPVLCLLGIGVVTELCITPSAAWLPAAVGTAPFGCLGMIVALSILPVLVLIQAMRSGAPRRPTLAGAAAGLCGGAIGATVFALYCPNDSVLFVACWYVLALTISCALGAIVGARRLAW